MKVAIHLVLLTVLSAPALGQDSAFRTFTSKSGQTIEGRIVDYDVAHREVKLETRDGRTANIHVAGLSLQDQTEVKKWEIGKLIATPAHFKITAKKVVVDKSRSEQGSLMTETKAMAYEVTLKNFTRKHIPPLMIKYATFYQQEDWDTGSNRKTTKAEYSEYKTKAIPPAGADTFTTESVSLDRKRYKDGYWGGSRKSTVDSSLLGIWLRLHLAGSDVCVFELTEPDKLKDSVTWDE